jgi:hypothetical protein
MKKQLIFFVIAIVAFLVVSHGAFDAALEGEVVAWGHNVYGQSVVPVGNDFVALRAAPCTV